MNIRKVADDCIREKKNLKETKPKEWHGTLIVYSNILA